MSDSAADQLVPNPEDILDSKIGVRDRADLRSEFIRVGEGIAESLRRRAGLAPDSEVLEVGCGLGRIARPLANYLTTGAYCGIDVVKNSIEWCNAAYRKFPNFHFIHADLFSTYYNPEGKLRAEEYRFPLEDDRFDIVWSSSLFTHLQLQVVDRYLEEMARVLKPGGHVWNTYLLLDEFSEPHVLAPRRDGRWMKFPVDGGRVTYRDKPEAVVALYKDRVLALHQKHGLQVTLTGLSNWSGGRPKVNFKGQDLIIAQKPL